MKDIDSPIILAEPLLTQQSHLHLNLSYQSNKYLQLLLPPQTTSKKIPFLLCLQTPNQPWPLDCLFNLTKKGFACALITIETTDLTQGTLDLHSATRALSLQAYQYQLDPHRYGLLAYDAACQVALQGVLTSTNQKFHKEDIQVLPIFYRSLFLLSPQITLNCLALSDYKRKTFPTTLTFQGQKDQADNLQALSDLTRSLANFQTEIVSYQILDCPHFSDAFYTPYVTDLIATAFTKNLHNR